MERNNFDKSSTGTNITASVFYDSGMAWQLWEENFERLADDRYFYTDHGQIKTPDITFTLKGSDDEIERAYKGIIAEDTLLSIDDKKEALIEWIEPSIATLETENYYLRKQGYDLEFIMQPELLCITTKGYCQGDRATIYYDPIALENLWGNYPDQDALRKDFDHMFWDQPIYACMTINGEEYHHGEMMIDPYEYDREAFATAITMKRGAPLAFKDLILAVLPENPDYL